MTYFPPSETQCACGCGFDITDKTRAKFDKIRSIYGSPLVVSGPARCRKRNTQEGGAEDSRHCHGDALDILVAGKSQYDVVRLACIAVTCGVKGIGVSSMFLHIDFRPSDRLVTWEY